MNLTGTPNNYAADEHNYWRANFQSRPYVTTGTPYEKYGPAYQFGWESQASSPGKTFDAVEAELAKAWLTAKARSGMKWEDAKPAVRDSWMRAAARNAQAA